jgi:hypothetical protein
MPFRGGEGLRGGAASAEILDRALVMFTLRRVVSGDGDTVRIDRGQDALLRYYAGSIAHFFDGGSP